MKSRNINKKSIINLSSILKEISTGDQLNYATASFIFWAQKKLTWYSFPSRICLLLREDWLGRLKNMIQTTSLGGWQINNSIENSKIVGTCWEDHLSLAIDIFCFRFSLCLETHGGDISTILQGSEVDVFFKHLTFMHATHHDAATWISLKIYPWSSIA